MLSLKRLIYILTTILIVSSIFFLFNLDNSFFKTNKINEADALTDIKLLKSEIPSFANANSYLVVGKPETSDEELIKGNILRILYDLKVNYGYSEDLSEGQLIGNKTIVFCISNVSTAIELDKLAEFITSGGKVIFAAGIPGDNSLSYLHPLWGIMEVGGYEVFKDIKFNNGSIPYEETLINNSLPTYSLNTRLRDSCTVLVQSSNSNPLIWINTYSKGRCGVINGNFMESKLSEGILVLTLANLEETFIYPIIGAKTVFLDAIPPLFNSNDKNSFKYYGRSSESFVRDRLWGVFLQNSKLYGLKYTTSFLAIDNSNIDLSYVNSQSFAYINKEIIKNKGEISLAGDHNKLAFIKTTRANSIKGLFDGLFPNYNIHSYYPLYGKASMKDIRALKATFSKLAVYRCYYYGNSTEQSIGNYEFLEEENLVSYPTITSGYKSEGLNMYNFISLLTSKGVISHSFDVNSLFTVPETESNWNTLDDFYYRLNEDFFKKTSWLESMTISQASQRVKAMDKLEFKVNIDDNKKIVYSNNVAPGQKFMLFSLDTPKKIIGASYKKINEHYYELTIIGTKFTIEFQ